MTERIDIGNRIAGEKALQPDEFITKSQLVEGDNITIETLSNRDIKINATAGGYKSYYVWTADEGFNCTWPDPDWWNGHVFPVSFALPYAGTFNFSFRLHLQSFGVKGAYPMQWMFTDDLDPLTSKTTFMVGDYHYSGAEATASTTRSTMLDLNAIHPRGTGILSTNVLGNGSPDGENTVLLINGNITVTSGATIQMYGRSLDPFDTSWGGNILKGSFFRIEEI